MTIEDFCDKLEAFLQVNILPKDMAEGELFFKYEWDSETYWIKLGLDDTWFTHDSDCDCEDCPENE